jgi:tellurite resistance protein TehA-like permease
MYESLKNMITSWNTGTNERIKLQHAYLALAVILVIAAGVVGLINYSLGQNILAVAIASSIIFVINAVSWSLLQSALVARLPKRNAPRKK